MDLQHIHENEIVVGQPIPWNVYDREGILLLREGHILETDHQLQELKERGLFLKRDPTDSHVAPPVREKPSPFVLLDGMYEQVEKLFGRMTVDSNFSEKVFALCKIVQTACDIDTNAALASIFIGREGRYSIVHPIHAAVLCELVARHMKWPVEERALLLAGAITMNIGMLSLQDKMYHQEEPASEAQRMELSKHPQLGLEILKNAGVTDEIWLNSVQQHHELFDGSGYPARLSGDAISRNAKMITLADVYGSLVQGRDYRPPMLQNNAMRELFLQRGKRADPLLADQFIKTVGLYPPGTFVRLVNGEVAIVTRHGKSVAAPIAHSVVGPRGAPLSVYIKRDCGNERFAIREPISKAQADIKIRRYQLWGYQ